jgi:hypothetical protein
MRQRLNHPCSAGIISWVTIQLMQGIHQLRRIKEHLWTAKLSKHKILKEARRCLVQTNMNNDAKRR